jgi:hypothetical protein
VGLHYLHFQPCARWGATTRVQLSRLVSIRSSHCASLDIEKERERDISEKNESTHSFCMGKHGNFREIEIYTNGERGRESK